MGYILILIALVSCWKIGLRLAFVLSALSLVGLYYAHASEIYVQAAGVMLLLFPIATGLRRLFFRLIWGVRDHFTDRRIPMPSRTRAAAWKKWGHTCVYCGARAECLDHVKPYWWLEAHGHKLHEVDNLRPACNRCNLKVGGKVFADLNEKRAWVRAHVSTGSIYKESPWARMFQYLR